MQKDIRIVLTGGGSGGHVYPALSIGEIVREKFPSADFLYIGTERGAEFKIVPARGIKMELLPIESFRRGIRSLPYFFSSFYLSVRRALKILQDYSPTLVISSGGYTSVPVLLAAYLVKRKKGIPAILLHEQNVVAGLANKIGGKFADKVAVTFELSKKFFPREKTVLTGYPVRKSIGGIEKNQARELLGIDRDAFLVFAFGGSSGSRTINRAIADALDILLDRENIHIIHAVGRYRSPEYDPEKDTNLRIQKKAIPPHKLARYHQILYTEEIDKYYAASDLVVCRCGSGTLAEIRKVCKPAILIPKMDSTGRHQYYNAVAFKKEGGAEVLIEKPSVSEKGVLSIDGKELARTILQLADNPARLKQMQSIANQNKNCDPWEKLGKIIEELISKSQSTSYK